MPRPGGPPQANATVIRVCVTRPHAGNDPEWAAGGASDTSSTALLEVWGLGPSKVRLLPEPGYGHEMLVELDGCAPLLEASRAFGDGEVFRDL